MLILQNMEVLKVQINLWKIKGNQIDNQIIEVS